VEDILKDVQEGKVSIEKAYTDYGVKIIHKIDGFEMMKKKQKVEGSISY